MRPFLPGKVALAGIARASTIVAMAQVMQNILDFMSCLLEMNFVNESRN
jgi:hypothetical protein